MKKLFDFIIVLIVPLIIVASLAFNLSVEKVNAVGSGSPAECTSTSNKDINPSDNGSTTPFVYNFDAGVGKVVNGVCIKSGDNMFGSAKHSGVLSNGTYESGCYTVSGVGTQIITVTRNLTGDTCQGISHLDINVVNAPVITASPTPTSGPTATPNPTPTSVPTPTLQPTPTPTLTPTPTVVVTPTDVPNENKITICHRDNNTKKPYVVITVDQSAADGIAGNSGNAADHFGEHQGPLASSEAVAEALKDDKIEWGDIIPLITGVHEGLNWTAEGQAIYNNECNYVARGGENPTPTPTPGTTATPTPTPGEPGRGGTGGGDGLSSCPECTKAPGVPSSTGGSVQGASTTPTGDPLKGVLGLSTTSSGPQTNPYILYVQLIGGLFFSLEAYRRLAKTA